MRKKIFFVLTIDTECDKSYDWGITYPISFKNIYESVPQVLEPLFSDCSIKATYLLSPEIIYDQLSMEVLKGQKNVELGTHLHSEFISPEPVEKPYSTFLTQVELRKEVEYEKLKNLTNLFKEKTGAQPTSFRSGRYGMSFDTLSILQSLGYKVDSSIMPYRKCTFGNNKSVDYWGAHMQPYYPSSSNYLKKGNMSIMEVPVTSLTGLVYKYPHLAKLLNPNKSRLKSSILSKLGLKDNRHYYLGPYRHSLDSMKKLTEFYVYKFRDSKVIVLNMMFHSNEVYPSASPYTNTWEEVNLFKQSIYDYSSYLTSNYDVESIGLSDVKDIII